MEIPKLKNPEIFIDINGYWTNINKIKELVKKGYAFTPEINSKWVKELNEGRFTVDKEIHLETPILLSFTSEGITDKEKWLKIKKELSELRRKYLEKLKKVV